MRRLVAVNDPLSQPTEVLRNRGERKLVLRATVTTRTEAAEPEDAREMGKQHFGALAVVARLLKGLGLL